MKFEKVRADAVQNVLDDPGGDEGGGKEERGEKIRIFFFKLAACHIINLFHKTRFTLYCKAGRIRQLYGNFHGVIMNIKI